MRQVEDRPFRCNQDDRERNESEQARDPPFKATQIGPHARIGVRTKPHVGIEQQSCRIVRRACPDDGQQHQKYSNADITVSKLRKQVLSLRRVVEDQETDDDRAKRHAHDPEDERKIEASLPALRDTIAPALPSAAPGIVVCSHDPPIGSGFFGHSPDGSKSTKLNDRASENSKFNSIIRPVR